MASAQVDVKGSALWPLMAIKIFRGLYLAEVQSLVGDQITRVALSVLVYESTGSPAATATVYALTFVPAIVGGAALSGLADRFSWRAVMIASDVIRCCLLLLAAVPGLPIVVPCMLAASAVFLGPVFRGAQLAMTANVLTADQLRGATGLRMMTIQLAQLAGFAAGGAIVSVVGSRGGLALDGLTFLASALIVAVSTAGFRQARSPGHPRADATEHQAQVSARSVFPIIFRDPRLSSFIALSWLAAFYVVPEGLAAPYAHSLGGGSRAIGILMATLPLGSVLGILIWLRIRLGRHREAAIGIAAVLSGVPLIACVATPAFGISVALWTLSGLFGAYQVDTATLFISAVPESHRGRAYGVYGSGLVTVQGVGIILFGVLSGWTGAGVAIAIAGATGATLALLPAWILARQPAKRRRA